MLSVKGEDSDEENYKSIKGCFFLIVYKKIEDQEINMTTKRTIFGKNTLFWQEKMGQHIYEKFHHLSVKETSKWLMKTKITK